MGENTEAKKDTGGLLIVQSKVRDLIREKEMRTSDEFIQALSEHVRAAVAQAPCLATADAGGGGGALRAGPAPAAAGGTFAGRLDRAAHGAGGDGAALRRGAGESRRGADGAGPVGPFPRADFGEGPARGLALPGKSVSPRSAGDAPLSRRGDRNDVGRGRAGHPRR